MGIFDGVLFCSDIDGTLVYDGKVSEENRKAIEYFKSEGGLFTLSTGRYPDYLGKNFSIQPNTFVVSVNGTVVSDKNGENIVYDKKLPLSFLEKVCDYVLSKYELETFWEADITSLEMPFGIYPTYDANKMMFVPKDEETALHLIKDLSEKFSDITDINRSWPTGVELIPKGSGKGECVKLLKKLTNSRLLVCAGDYENDVTMLKEADIGYAIKSGVKAAHDAADRITKSTAGENAVAEIIYELEKELKEQGIKL